MAQNAQPIGNYGGRQLLMGVQANLYTVAGAFDTVRFESIGGYVVEEFLTRQQKQHGKRNDADFADPYVDFEQRRDDALTVTLKIRKSTDDSSKDPPIVTILESAGYEVVENTATTVVSYTPATGALVLTDEIFGGAKKNVCVLVELDDGRYWPTWLSTYDNGTKTGTTAVKLPSTPSALNNVDRMYTCVPMIGKVSTAKYLSFKLLGLGPSLTYLGCSCSGMEISEITPAGDLTVTFTFHVLDVSVGATAMAADDFQDANTELLCHGAQVHYSDYAAPPMDANPVIVNRLKFTNPYKTKGADGVGNTTTVLNETQFYTAYRPAKDAAESPVKVEIDQVYDTQEKTDYDADTAKCLVYTKHTTALTVPAVLIAIPKAIHDKNPAFSENEDLGLYVSNTVLRGTSADLGSNNDPSDRGNRDFIFALSGDI